MASNTPPPIAPGSDTPGPRPPVTTSGSDPSTATLFGGSVRVKPNSSDSKSTPASAEASAPSDATSEAGSVGPPATEDGKQSTKGRGGHKQSAEYRREKELRQKAFRAKMDKVRLALWPTNEAVKQMEQAIGNTINYERLGNSDRFMDAWADFNKKKVPSGNDRETIKNLAKKVLSASKDRRANERGRSTEEAAYKKRPRDQSASSTTSSGKSGKVKPLPKIPKVKQSPTGVAKPESTPLPEGSVSSQSTDHRGEADVDMEGVVEDEASEPAIETFTTGLGEALDYANAARPKQGKKESQFVLFIHKGSEVRERVTREQWKIFLEKFNAALFDIALSGGANVPKIDWSGFSNGTGVVVPMDAESQAKVIDIVNTIEVAETKFRAWPKGVQDTHTIVTIKLPASLSCVPAMKAAEGIANMNGLPENGWQLYNTKSLPKSKERVLQLVVTKACFDSIRDRDGRLLAGANQVEVHYKRVRLHR